jgi:hypothetical protein
LKRWVKRKKLVNIVKLCAEIFKAGFDIISKALSEVVHVLGIYVFIGKGGVGNGGIFC